MTRERMVPLGGLTFIVTALLMLATIISRSPYTHSNLWTSLPADYSRTGVDTIEETDLEAIRAELARLPQLAKSAPSDRRLVRNTANLPEPAMKPASVDSSAFGKALFTQKCTSCHTIGEGRRVGPDLKGITAQRPDGWLAEFIASPDKVIARGDPIATQLVRAYGMPMPNLGVSKIQAQAILDYIQRKSEDTSAVQVALAPAPAGSDMAGLAAVGPGAAAAAPAQQNASRGKAQFDQKCASCHTVGGGKLVGPDLKGIGAQRPRDWLIEFISTPDKVIARGDATAAQLLKEYGVPMPNLGVSNADAEAILAYLESPGGGAVGQAVPAGSGNPAVGRALFTGERPLANGGPACISCHNVAGVGALAGGSWGLDLTRAQSRTGPTGLTAIMKSPPFPGMKEAFAAHPVTDGEVVDLLAFFAEAERQPAATPADFIFPVIGLVALVTLVAIAQLLWRGRARGVRKPLVGGAR